jgi:hypothetical protein
MIDSTGLEAPVSPAPPFSVDITIDCSRVFGGLEATIATGLLDFGCAEEALCLARSALGTSLGLLSCAELDAKRKLEKIIHWK